MGSGISTSKPLGNNGSGVSMSTPLGGSGGFVSQAAPVLGGYMAAPLGAAASIASMAGLSSSMHSGGDLQRFSQHPFMYFQHGINTDKYMANQKRDAAAQANQAGLIGQQAGNALGGGSQGGGIGAHYSNLGYNNALAQFAQMTSQQNSQAQGQAMQGIGSLLAMLGMFV